MAAASSAFRSASVALATLALANRDAAAEDTMDVVDADDGADLVDEVMDAEQPPPPPAPDPNETWQQYVRPASRREPPVRRLICIWSRMLTVDGRVDAGDGDVDPRGEPQPLVLLYTPHCSRC